MLPRKLSPLVNRWAVATHNATTPPAAAMSRSASVNSANAPLLEKPAVKYSLEDLAVKEEAAEEAPVSDVVCGLPRRLRVILLSVGAVISQLGQVVTLPIFISSFQDGPVLRTGPFFGTGAWLCVCMCAQPFGYGRWHDAVAPLTSLPLPDTCLWCCIVGAATVERV